MGIYVKLNPPTVVKSSGKKNVDDAALKDFAAGLKDGLKEFKDELKAPIYILEEPKPKPEKGYAVDSSLTEIKITIAGQKGTVSLKTSVSVGTWPNTLMFGFGKNEAAQFGGIKDDDLARSAAEAGYGAGHALAAKVDFAIKSKEPKK